MSLPGSISLRAGLTWRMAVDDRMGLLLRQERAKKDHPALRVRSAPARHKAQPRRAAC